MTLSVQFEAEAEAEYRLAGRWYEERCDNLGVEFFNAVDAAIRRIVEWPGAGGTVPRVSADLGVRRCPVTRFPYHVVYLHSSTAIRILAIAHDRRKPGYWQSRLD